MSDSKNVDPRKEQSLVAPESNIAVSSSETSVVGSVKVNQTPTRTSTSSDRQIKFERAQKCLENAALVSKRIKEHRKATAELLGRPFEEDDGGDTVSEMATTISERTGYSAATDVSTTMSVQDALNIPGISESLANTLKQKELLIERIKQYKEISKRPIKKSAVVKKESSGESKVDLMKNTASEDLTQLHNSLKEKENMLTIMQVKIKTLETTILDLQEKLNEKDQIIEAKNKATTLMSDSLSKKERDSMSLLEDTKQQMTKMQENFIIMETEWKEAKQCLMKEIETKDEKIRNLEEANTILENSRFEISLAHSKLVEEIDLKSKEISYLQQKIESMSQLQDSIKHQESTEEEKGSLEISSMVELTNKIELLEQINCQIRQTNKELENKLAKSNVDMKPVASASPSKKPSPLPTRRGGRNTASKSKSPWSSLSVESLPEIEPKLNKNEITKLEMVIQSLNKEILEKEYVISQKNATIKELQDLNSQRQVIASELQKGKDMVDIGISTEIVDVPLTVEALDVENKARQDEEKDSEASSKDSRYMDLENKLADLTNEIEAANKNMIKVKLNHKLKLKQMQKTIDNFSKVSDVNAEIIRLNEEIHRLTQKVAVLEEEKGNLQLHLVDYDSGRLTEIEVNKKMTEIENLAETRLKAISVLETQKFELVQELHVLQQKYAEAEDKLADISHLQNEQVCSEMKSVQMEEQIDELTALNKELQLIIENLKLDKEELNGTITSLLNEKEEFDAKLQHYIQENIELTDKLEKLSAEKVSSAESIEIVESLTVQEKLELEEYNKKMSESMMDDNKDSKVGENIGKIVEESAELNKKIELFTQERQEVMEKMNLISAENESLHTKMEQLVSQTQNLQSTIDVLNKEKHEILFLNDELTRRIEELRHERIEIMKESLDTVKPTLVEDTTEGCSSEIHHDDKTALDKNNSRTKTVKQLTKEILKLKSTIKEREDEIADCQMKILSLEEQQQKQNELLNHHVSCENKLTSMSAENSQLREELESLKTNQENAQQLRQIQEANELLQIEIQKVRQEFAHTLHCREVRIQELENLLLEYEKQIYNYGNTLQQKDKELVEYINQITKLNDVSQKLKSTIELLEEEKAKDPNAELVKTLNKQISVCQKKMSELDEKLRMMEDEKSQLMSLKTVLENKNMALETELRKTQESLTEKQAIVKELQAQQQIYSDEMSTVILQAKERDEEIHEIKLQLRKESIENEKLRTDLTEKEDAAAKVQEEFELMKTNLSKISSEYTTVKEQYTTLETKNRELMEKLKKFAVTIKKKASMYTELESHLAETQNQLEKKNEQLQQLLIQVETLPVLNDKLKHAEEELDRLQAMKVNLEQQKSQNITTLENENCSLKEDLLIVTDEISNLKSSLDVALEQANLSRNENVKLKAQIDSLNNKLVEYEIDQKNNINFTTKISSLETEITQKNEYLIELQTKIENLEQQLSQLEFGYNAKVQEKDLYIENLESEISKHKLRICRLEESISAMEDSRQSLERKADRLDSQLQEKRTAYTEYTSQEDELANRLAVLMDHDKVIEKQLHEIEYENKELQTKTQFLNEDNQRLKKSLSDIQNYCNSLVEKADKADLAESAINKYQAQISELENNYKRITTEHQILLMQKKHDIEELETEFNTQIENAIKEKKTSTEKYEKTCEYVAQLEEKLREYHANIQHLNINQEELVRINQELTNKYDKEKVEIPDYTEQYISEINSLNSIINLKNEELTELNKKIQMKENNYFSTISNLEAKLSEMNIKLEKTTEAMQIMDTEIRTLRSNNQQLETFIYQKDEHIKQLIEAKKVTFEIPETERMVISSTIQSLSGEHQGIDLSSLESQIVSDQISPSTSFTATKESESMQQKSSDVDVEKNIETEIVPKKTYLCYENAPEGIDPFNSNEGWGLGESEEPGDMTSEMSHLNNKILQLQSEKDNLKASLDTSNNKLIKAIKKVKELKASNDMISNELKILKNISQSSFLDTAIEDELKNTILELEKRNEELVSDLQKEKREKEAIKKQNEVFNNANERLTEMKEKLDNEIELWKYKFKEANDKLSAFQWSDDSKESPKHKILLGENMQVPQINEEIAKLEKENDELQALVDQLSINNQELSTANKKLENEMSNINKQIQLSTCENCKTLECQIQKFQTSNAELLSSLETGKKTLNDLEISFNELKEKYDSLKDENQKLKEIALKNNELIEETNKLKEQNMCMLEMVQAEAKGKISILQSELETYRDKLRWHQDQQNSIHQPNSESIVISEKYNAMQESCLEFKQKLDVANDTIAKLEIEKQEIKEINNNHEEQINQLHTKLQNLNTENDKLLSTVAELRSSISSAVDQRGFEIAELWKQHLAQRENDFQKAEHDLRVQLNASEVKYEQLLDSVQSSTQEETNKLVMMEQLSSFQNKLQDKEEHLRDLQDKYGEVVNQLDMLRSEMEDEKLMHENKILSQQEEYEKQIRELMLENQGLTDNLQKELNKINYELADKKSINDALNLQLEELNNKLQEQAANILDLNIKLRNKDDEIYQKTHDYTIAISQRNEEFESIRKQLIEYEKKVEELSYEKESELAILRLKMHETKEHYESKQKQYDEEKLKLTEALEAKILECTHHNKQIVDLNNQLKEHSNTISEMQAALENQEFEIVTLKDEISSLQQELRSSNNKVHKHVTFAADTKSDGDGEKTESVLSKELLDAVPRAELDLALYMLHQRDVRCEELTMELTQLLEERDTLQLRLSDSLRSYEDLKQRCNAATLDVSAVSMQDVVSELPTFIVEKEQQFVDTHRGQTSRSSSISETDEKPKLKAKLSELRSVRQSRDVRLRHDSEQRQLDMRLLHRDVAQLPPEAVDQLAQAHHTLSRDSQSTSTVLLNWLRGKSTPKVVDM